MVVFGHVFMCFVGWEGVYEIVVKQSFVEFFLLEVQKCIYNWCGERWLVGCMLGIHESWFFLAFLAGSVIY